MGYMMPSVLPPSPSLAQWLEGGTKNPTIFNILCWADCLIDQASDGPSIILID